MPEQVAYQFVNFLFDGKMVSSKNAFALGSNEYQMVKNMRYVEDGVVTRKGCSIHNSSDVNDGSTEVRSIAQMVVDRYSLTRTIIQADDLKYYYDDDLPTAGSFTELTMNPTTENASALKAISAGVGETEIFCNGEENWVYHGTQPRPTAIFHYDDSASSYISWIDEIYSLITTDVMLLTGMTDSDYVYLGFWVPFSGAYFDITSFNAATAAMGAEYFNGAWTALLPAYVSGGETDAWDGSAIGDWTDADGGAGASSQVAFGGFETFGFDSDPADTPASPDVAIRWNADNNFGTRVTISFDLYVDETGTGHTGGGMRFSVNSTDGTRRLEVDFSTQGIRVYDGGAYVEVGTDEVVLDTWQTWTFDANFSTELCQVYLDDAQIGVDVDISYTVALAADEIQFANYGYTTNSEMYVKDIRLGTTVLSPAGLVDGTVVGNATFGQPGTISWTLPTDWVPTMVEGGLWYFARFQPTASLTPAVTSNANLLDDDCSSLAAWTDQDAGDGTTTQQASAQGATDVFTLDAGTNGGGNRARQLIDVGTFADNVTVTLRLYHESLGAGQANGDNFDLFVAESAVQCSMQWCSDGLFVYDGAAWNEVGVNIVDLGTWNKWTLVFDFSTPATATVDVYKNDVLEQAGVDCSATGSYTDGQVRLTKSGNTTSDIVTHVDYVKVGDDLTSTTDIDLTNIYIHAPMQKLVNLWDQNWQPVSGCYHFDETQSEYKDYLPKVIDGITATYMFLEDFEGGADNDAIYIGTPYKPLAFRIKVDPEHTNTGNAEFDVIEGWDGNSWDAGTGLSDTTKGGAADIASLSQNGIISFNNGSIAYRRGMLEGEDFPMYWTRLEIDADNVSAEVRIWDVAYVPDLDDPSGAKAVMEFKDRALLVGLKDYPNEVWISAPFNPQGFNGNEFTKMVFGDGRTLTDGKPFFNEAVVFKEDSTWLIQGFRRTGAGAFGRLQLDSRVGAFRKTAQLGRIWVTQPEAAADDYRNVIFFQHRTGVYFTDGNKPVYISDDINSYFDENHADYVGAANIAGIDSWFDYYKDEYHLLFATGLELIYNAWFKKWSVFDRSVDLKSGGAVVGSSGEPLTYGGTAIGKVMRLEFDTSDKDSVDADAAIDAHVITKAHWPGELEHEINFRRLILVGEGNLANGGVITINGAQDGGDITDNTDPQYFTLDDTLDTADTYNHKGYVKDMFPFSIGDDDIEEALHTLQLKFGCDTLDLSIKLVGYGLGVAIQRAHFDE